MGERLLDKITVTPLKRIPTIGGDVLKILTKEDCNFKGFGEAYFSMVLKGAIKAWKCHREMTLNLVVPVGQVRFVFYEVFEGEKNFRIEELGNDRYALLTVPPGIWFGFQGIADETSLLLNISNIVHDPKESDRCDKSTILFNW
jgi:dTDP-4-dehydrorhamnose 3,5-epimerase